MAEPLKMSERTKQAFTDATPENLRHLHSLAIAAYKESQSRAGRMAGLALLTVALFELFASDPGARITLGPLQLARSLVLLTGFPPVFAYFLLEAVMSISASLDRYGFHMGIYKLIAPGEKAADLVDQLEPAQPVYFGLPFEVEDPDFRGKLDASIRTGFVVAAILLAPLHLVRMFWLLFDELGSSVTLWVSCLLTTAMAVAYAMTLWTTFITEE